jgi:hypothetical protein
MGIRFELYLTSFVLTIPFTLFFPEFPRYSAIHYKSL